MCSISPVAISVCAVFRPLLSVCVQYFARCYQCVCSISPIAISVCSILPVAISVCAVFRPLLSVCAVFRPLLSVCAVFPCVQTMLRLPVLGLLTCAHMLMQAIAHGGCTDTVRESALKADSGRQSLVAPGTRTRVSIAPGFQSDVLPTELSPPLRFLTAADFVRS